MVEEPIAAMKARWSYIQPYLFPFLRQEIDPLTAKLEQLVHALDMIGLEAYVRAETGGPGRPRDDRRAIARAFVAKAILGLPSTTALRERLLVDASLRRICGWERRAEIPSEPTFSRAFREFAEEGLVDRIHQALVERSFEDRIVGVVARDATEIEAREKPAAKDDEPPPPAAPPRKRGRPRKDEPAPAPRPEPVGAPNEPTAGADVRRPADPMRCRNQEKQQRRQGKLDRIQSPYRRRLRSDPRLLDPDLGVPARFPSRHSAHDHDRSADRLSL